MIFGGKFKAGGLHPSYIFDSQVSYTRIGTFN